MIGAEEGLRPETARTTSAASVTVVIVNYNAGELLDRCLDSVRDHGAPCVARTVVIDNASTDGSPERAAKRADVEVVANGSNVGFAVANNVALRQVLTEYVLLLNPDAALLSNGLAVLLETLSAHPNAAAVGPRLTYPDGRLQRWTAGREPGLASIAAFGLGIDRAVATRRPPGGLYLGRDIHEPILVDWISGACLLLRSRALHEVGLFDETFFCYMEDVDLCRRLRERGWEIRYQPRAGCVHHHGGSSPRDPRFRVRVGRSDDAVANLMRYHARRHGALDHAMFRATAFVCFGARAFLHGALAGVRRGGNDRDAAENHLRHAITVLRAKRVPTSATPAMPAHHVTTIGEQ